MDMLTLFAVLLGILAVSAAGLTLNGGSVEVVDPATGRRLAGPFPASLLQRAVRDEALASLGVRALIVTGFAAGGAVGVRVVGAQGGELRLRARPRALCPLGPGVALRYLPSGTQERAL